MNAYDKHIFANICIRMKSGCKNMIIFLVIIIKKEKPKELILLDNYCSIYEDALNGYLTID